MTQLVVNTAQRSNVEKLAVRFDQNMNLDASIGNGQITAEARIVGPGNIAVPLTAGRYSWNATTFTPSVAIPEPVATGLGLVALAQARRRNSIVDDPIMTRGTAFRCTA